MSLTPLLLLFPPSSYTSLFFFNDTATTEIYTLSLHDALPIWRPRRPLPVGRERSPAARFLRRRDRERPPLRPCQDRKSTRLNSSHGYISYAVFCLKKKKKKKNSIERQIKQKRHQSKQESSEYQ